jgi:hypothetical protein
MVNLITFAEALAKSKPYPRRHLVLGNGFSIACKRDIFAYRALFEQAKFEDAQPLTRRAFDVLGTSDFEEVMRALRDTSKLLRMLGSEHNAVADQFSRGVSELREILVTTIARQHPERPSDVSAAAYGSARAFLSNFDCIYTLSYDLLLYWALMQTTLQPAVRHDDGFRTPEDGPAAYVTWDVERTDQQNVFYLHGALHLFDAGAELKKFTWINTGIRLIEQVREALNQDLFPLIVAEGTSQSKKAKIVHSNYLSRGYRSLAKIGGAVFIFGHSLAEKDEHILRLIEKGPSKHLFVGVHGDPSSPTNKALIQRAMRLQAGRRQRQLDLYDASSALVWG